MKLTLHLSKPAQGFWQKDKIERSAIMDGYSFYDRLLEGIIFKAELTQPQTLIITLNDSEDGSYMSDLNAPKMFKIAGERFVRSGGQNNSTRCHGVHQGNDKGYSAFFLGTETTPSNRTYQYDIDPALLRETGFRSYDGTIVDFEWEEGLENSDMLKMSPEL